jgi:hypothetical protein
VKITVYVVFSESCFLIIASYRYPTVSSLDPHNFHVDSDLAFQVDEDPLFWPSFWVLISDLFIRIRTTDYGSGSCYFSSVAFKMPT